MKQPPQNSFYKNNNAGYTLAEVLIVLGILAIISTLTLRTIVLSNQTASHNAIAKESMAMIGSAYEAFLQGGGDPSNIYADALTPYMNYIKTDTSSQIDNDLLRQLNASNFIDCSGHLCLKLHTGAMLYPEPNYQFNGLKTDTAVLFILDPDGRYSGTAAGPGKSLYIYLYYDGKIRTANTLLPNTDVALGTINPVTNSDPSWFSFSN